MKTYGCHNSKRADGYYAPMRRYDNQSGNFTMQNVWIKDTSSKECRYDRQTTDDKCKGCEK